MNLPSILPPDSFFRPWDLVIGVCLLACVPRSTRRWGAILTLVSASVLGLSTGLAYVFHSFAP